LASENAGLFERLRTLSSENARLETRERELAALVSELRGKDAIQLEAELQRARLDVADINRAIETTRAQIVAERTQAAKQVHDTQRQITLAMDELGQVRQQVVQTQDLALLQEAGIYEYRHPLADAVAYKARLAELTDQIKACVRNGSAVEATTMWTVNNSAAEGTRMVRDFSKLMLRAYNAEADNCARSMKPYRLATSVERLSKTRETIARLGKTMSIRITDTYHRLRVTELELTADYLAKVAEEKERIREERERQRDEENARRDFEREKARLTKEQAHWQGVQEKWAASGDETKAAEARAKLDEIEEAIRGVEAREANIRTGWVYVISNIGAFGDRMVKIGLTRRLDPNERVRELGDASVPFRFDVHALIFSPDAVSLEKDLHRLLTDRRVNRVNARREFFHATPAEVLDRLQKMDTGQHVLEYTEEPEALEWRASVRLASAASTAPVK
jgi:hypothetical protein